MAKAPADLRSLARAQTAFALNKLIAIARDSENDSARVAASIHILERGWGKAPATFGADGEGIAITIRHIVEGTQRAIEHAPLELKPDKVRE